MLLHSVNVWNLAFYALMVFMATLGLWDVFFGFEENKCSMSYMFEYPEYQKIELPKKLAKRYPAYELYLYGEGSYAEEHKVLPLTGIPVLFLPGNAGSYKQVRSIGSIALRKAEDIDFKYHFDFFSVNFNEELVALYGGSLQKQTKFVHECIKTILKLYKGQEFAPKSVAIIGHSMGGLVARALLTLKNFKQDLINLLVTQATPHVAPVMPLDRFITDFYMTVNNYWILNARQINLTTLSVAGGFRDYQVRSGLTFLPKLSHHTSALSVVSSAVPKTWVSTDHLSIVWCKQLQLTTIRAFFDLIDADTKQITQNPKKKLSVLNHHFIRHPAKHFEENPAIISDLTGTSMWVPVKVSKWTYVAYNESDKIYFTFPLANHRKIYTHVYCQSTMLSWVFIGRTDVEAETPAWHAVIHGVAKIDLFESESKKYIHVKCLFYIVIFYNIVLCFIYSNYTFRVASNIRTARILEWIAIPFSRGSSQPRDRTHISFATVETQFKIKITYIYLCVLAIYKKHTKLL
ncbi:hypothetical protein FD755_009194 [Muntiacus reevesi]|uniref:GPI inositol-deacylase n=1 Tax=Muntiacus reevesi TaxID=9886 RepID=A0A5J5MMS3_MUNRE|nr:hypothetical protein FD755_009194 [Muntiacus reevesi]